jgi:tRNA G18 (ribose-2'-O)-methylase SpoU
MSESPGYFGIGIYQAKRFENVGVLRRWAYQLGASYIFTIGKRYRRQSSDTHATWKHIPLHSYSAFDDFFDSIPFGCRLIGIESGGTDLPDFQHPERAVYLLGAEDGGLPRRVLERCHQSVTIPAIGLDSYNVAQAGTLVMYDRFMKTRG